MASAATVSLNPPALPMAISDPMPNELGEAKRLAALFKDARDLLRQKVPSFDRSNSLTFDQILALPAGHSQVRIPDELHDLPSRRGIERSLAQTIANLVGSTTTGEASELSNLIQYEDNRKTLRAWVVLQRKHDILAATKRKGLQLDGLTGSAVFAPAWSSRILAQGPYDQTKHHVSTDGVKAIPMPVAVAEAADLAPFFDHLRQGGTHELDPGSSGVDLDEGQGEPHYGVKAAEFRKGVVYEDGRMDLCKMVVGPDDIGNLMDSLRPNTFVRHFLLGNNIIGPVGAKEIANFIKCLPDRMDTWYLAGNCIDAPSFKILVDAMVQSPAATNIWLKRNPLGPTAFHDAYRLITETKNLRTLDLDQTELGDAGLAKLFIRLSLYTDAKLPLQNLYLNGTGMSLAATTALAAFLASPACGLTSIYMSCNPIGDAGARILAKGIRKAPQLLRLSLQSIAITSIGATALCNALASHPSISALDLGQHFATMDLGQMYNFIQGAAAPAIVDLVKKGSLEYLRLGHCPMDAQAIFSINDAVLQSKRLLYYDVTSILPITSTEQPRFSPSSDARMPIPGAGGAKSPLQESTEKYEQRIRARLEANVQAKFDEDVTYPRFLSDELRWGFSDKTDVRKIDSVYRNRDAGLARRGLKTLVKDWEEGDDTLAKVMNAKGPFCTMKRHSDRRPRSFCSPTENKQEDTRPDPTIHHHK